MNIGKGEVELREGAGSLVFSNGTPGEPVLTVAGLFLNAEALRLFNEDWGRRGYSVPKVSVSNAIPPPDDQVDRAASFLKALTTPSAKFQSKYNNSYFMKHAVEHWHREHLHTPENNYVSNGAFILAALQLGYRVRFSKIGGMLNAGPNVQIALRAHPRPPRGLFYACGCP